MSPCIPIAPFGDRPVVVVAGGPSLTLRQVRFIGMARSKDQCRVIAVNDAIYPCWFADVAYACDRKWWEWDRHVGLPHFKGMKISLEPTKYPDVRALKHTGIEGYDEEIGCLRSGSNSGYQAVHLAAKLGARSIITVALDYSGSRESANGSMDHWFGRHGEGFDRNSDTAKLRGYFQALTEELGRRGIVVRNASPESTVTWLPRVDLRSNEWLSL